MTPRRPVRSLLVALALAPALALSPAAPGSAAPSFPDSVPLPSTYAPEGIAGGPGTTFFAGNRTGGGVYRGDLRTGQGEVLVPAQAQGASIGMQYDDATGLLWVAGGGTGTVTAYDGRTGAVAAQYTVPATGAGVFLNDVDITEQGVFVTDSRNPRLVVVPDASDGSLPASAQVLPLTGFTQPPGFGLNGIRALPGGDLLVVAAGELYRVDPATGAARRLTQTSGRDLTGGDGLELRGSTLYVVYGFADGDPRNDADYSVAVVKLAQGATSYAVTGELRKDTPDSDDLERPTTALFANGSLWVVNGKFDTAAPEKQEVVRLQP